MHSCGEPHSKRRCAEISSHPLGVTPNPFHPVGSDFAIRTGGSGSLGDVPVPLAKGVPMLWGGENPPVGGSILGYTEFGGVSQGMLHGPGTPMGPDRPRLCQPSGLPPRACEMPRPSLSKVPVPLPLVSAMSLGMSLSSPSWWGHVQPSKTQSAGLGDKGSAGFVPPLVPQSSIWMVAPAPRPPRSHRRHRWLEQRAISNCVPSSVGNLFLTRC